MFSLIAPVNRCKLCQRCPSAAEAFRVICKVWLKLRTGTTKPSVDPERHCLVCSCFLCISSSSLSTSLTRRFWSLEEILLWLEIFTRYAHSMHTSLSSKRSLHRPSSSTGCVMLSIGYATVASSDHRSSVKAGAYNTASSVSSRRAHREPFFTNLMRACNIRTVKINFYFQTT